jgi:hypothetical protein
LVQAARASARVIWGWHPASTEAASNAITTGPRFTIADLPMARCACPTDL